MWRGGNQSPMKLPVWFCRGAGAWPLTQTESSEPFRSGGWTCVGDRVLCSPIAFHAARQLSPGLSHQPPLAVPFLQPSTGGPAPSLPAPSRRNSAPGPAPACGMSLEKTLILDQPNLHLWGLPRMLRILAPVDVATNLALASIGCLLRG